MAFEKQQAIEYATQQQGRNVEINYIVTFARAERKKKPKNACIL
jgi:hypothetical protein